LTPVSRPELAGIFRLSNAVALWPRFWHFPGEFYGWALSHHLSNIDQSYLSALNGTHQHNSAGKRGYFLKRSPKHVERVLVDFR
jgi:hypothetical protein